MENVKSFLLNSVANADLKTTNGSKLKIEQRTRNALKKDFTDILVQSLKTALESDLITVVRTEKGIGISIDNEKIGYIPIEINAMFKDLEIDIMDMGEEYQEKLKSKAEKAEKAKIEKAKKIERSKAERLAKAKALEKLKVEQPQESEEEDFE